MHLDIKVATAFVVGMLSGFVLFSSVSFVPSENKMHISMKNLEMAYRKYYTRTQSVTDQVDTIRNFVADRLDSDDLNRFGKDVWNTDFIIETNDFPQISIVSKGPRHLRDISYRMAYTFDLEK